MVLMREVVSKKYQNDLDNERKLELVKELREETGWSMMDCKRALYESNWIIIDAIVWLNKFNNKVLKRI